MSDPLYSDGADFFLPRKALEGAWNGIALAVMPLSPPRKPLVAWLARFRAGVIMTGPLLFYPSEANVDQSPAFRFTSAPSVEPKISMPQMQQAGVHAGAVPWVSGNALLLLTEALNPLRKEEMNTPDVELGNTRPVEPEPNGSPQLNAAVAAGITLSPPRHNVPPRQDVTVLRGAKKRP